MAMNSGNMAHIISQLSLEEEIKKKGAVMVEGV
jgi:hypothetical protein